MWLSLEVLYSPAQLLTPSPMGQVILMVQVILILFLNHAVPLM